jgi:uncharacterized membrane protein
MRIPDRSTRARGAAVRAATLILLVAAGRGAPAIAAPPTPEPDDMEWAEDFEIIDAGAAQTPPRIPVLFGRLHILVLHFPIAWVWLAAILAVLGLRHPTRIGHWDLILAIAAAASFLPALATGWVHHLNLDPHLAETILMDRHKTLAFIAFGFVAAAAALRTWAAQQHSQLPRRLATATLCIGTILTSTAAHFGGSMVYGPDFLHFW